MVALNKKNPTIVKAAAIIPSSKEISKIASEAGIQESVEKLKGAKKVVEERAAKIANGNNVVKRELQQSKGQVIAKEQVDAPKRPSKP